MEEEKYRFLATWFDLTMKVNREFLLTYFPSDGSLEMYDRQLKRLFLKRMKFEHIDINDLYVGSTVNVLSRQLELVGFGDKKTAEKFSRESETTLIIVKSEAYKNLGKIIDILHQNDLTICKGRMVNTDDSILIKSSFGCQIGASFAVFEVRGADAIDMLKKVTGKESLALQPLKAELGVLSQQCLIPESESVAKSELEVFFPSGKELHCNTATLENCTCCIVKPHAVREGKTGKIIQDIIDAGFKITALEFINFDRANASEFFEVYKGTVPYYAEMVSQLMSGPALALEITKENSTNIVQDFRDLVGPANSEVASKLRPKTLRARYGVDTIKNAVHCTDLPEDGRLEVEYLFRILQVL